MSTERVERHDLVRADVAQRRHELERLGKGRRASDEMNLSAQPDDRSIAFKQPEELRRLVREGRSHRVSGQHPLAQSLERLLPAQARRKEVSLALGA